MTVRRLAIVAGLTILVAGCLEPPVSESLDVRMLRGGASVVSIGVSLRSPKDYADNPKVQQRLEAESRGIEAGTDPWSVRLRDGEPERERDVFDREQGRLRRIVRHARLESPEDLRAFFRDTGVGVSWAAGKGWEELTILPGRTGRPTSAQRAKVKAALDAWSAAVSAYLAATAELYAYLEGAPERARACFGVLLTKLPEGESLSEDERRLTKAVDDAMGEVGGVLVAPADEAYTIDELSRLVYDPFPAPIRVAVPGPIVEREGFPGDLAAPLAIPVSSLWSAFERLESRWAAPDVALAAWRKDIAGDAADFDLDAFAALPRRASAPGADDVRRAIEDELRVASVYRVRWSTEGEDAGGPLPF